MSEMYLEHFSLNDAPFSIAPNPRYLYLTYQHQEALAHLTYGLGSAGGVILLTGEVGTGKTTISRKLLEGLPEHIDIAWIVNPRLSVEELLAAICDELSISYSIDHNSIKVFTDLINAYLIEAHGHGRNVVVMIDEAQNLSPGVLEQLRLLTNLETSERKLLQIILLGQPELKEMLERNDLRQLAQRITARYHLPSLSKEEISEYIRYRLAVAGCNRPVFTKKAIDLIFHFSHGTPRLINLLCDRALLGVYSRNEAMVGAEHVQQASKEVLGVDGVAPKRRLFMPLMVVLALLVGMVMLFDDAEPWLAQKYALYHIENAPIIMNPAIANQLTSDQAIAGSVAMAALSLYPDNLWRVIEETGTKSLAFQTLAEQWHTSITDEGGDLCDKLRDKKLLCLQQPINLWLLGEYNRPAIFRLTGSDGHDHYAVIRSIEGGKVVIQLDQQRWSISTRELEEHWKGQFTLLWLKPPGYTEQITLGDTGIIVQWLVRQMDALQGEMIPRQEFKTMNTMLVERLKNFQQSEGLPADGIAATLTLIRINERIDQSLPRLTRGELF